ncbi:MAG TPA: nuclear transport factor 2 family protein [Longimicrobiales bacterium]|nr:nuclear transport factor 2 family protein [Longimicrobiales bacterium]
MVRDVAPMPFTAPLPARATRRLRAWPLLLAGVAGCTPQPQAPDGEGSGTGAPGSTVVEPAAADSVRAAREAFNRAIVEMEMAPIEALVLDDYVLVTGRSSIYAGAEPHLELWRGDFASPEGTYIYVRTPREVRVNPDFGLAEELGNWVGRPRSGDGSGEVSGVYAAKWQRAVDGAWMLQSEVFTTLECAGPICEPPDPVEAR